MFDITGKKLWFLIISGTVIVVGIVALAVFGLRPGIDFSSGSITTLSFDKEVVEADLEQELATLGYSQSTIERSREGDYIIRTVELTIEDKAALKDELAARFDIIIEEKGFEKVDPVIARETGRIAGIAVAVAAIGILLYITWAFRRMPSPLHYGACAIVALAHDVLMVLGIFAILGAIWGWEINLMFITGILAVIGYSVNNTVVIFDRIRENLTRGINTNFEVVVNNSLVETLGRSLNTSLTTLIVVLALLLFVGASIQNFAVVLLIGIVAGTYSSLFVAPLLLTVWEKRRSTIRVKGG